MSLSRTLAASLLSAVASFSIVTASGCGTSAVGVEDCRDIELARCHAGPACGLLDDVSACDRYYRDHCLHGLAKKPSASADVDACVKAIQAAGECAKRDPETALVECGDENIPGAQPGLQTACEMISHPERSAECHFLTDVPLDSSTGGQPATGTAGAEADPETPSAGAAGQSAAGGAASE